MELTQSSEWLGEIGDLLEILTLKTVRHLRKGPEIKEIL